MPTNRLERRRGHAVLKHELTRIRELFGGAQGQLFQGIQANEQAQARSVADLEQSSQKNRQRLRDVSAQGQAGTLAGLEQAGLGGTSIIGATSQGLNTQLQADLDVLDSQTSLAFGDLQRQFGGAKAQGLAELAELGARQFAVEGRAFFDPVFNLFSQLGGGKTGSSVIQQGQF